MRRIGEIEGLEPELKVVFSPGHPEALRQDEIEVAEAGPEEHVAAGIAVDARGAGHEGELVEPAVDGRLVELAAADPVAAVAGSAVLRVPGVTHVEGEARPEGQETADLPPSEERDIVPGGTNTAQRSLNRRVRSAAVDVAPRVEMRRLRPLISDDEQDVAGQLPLNVEEPLAGVLIRERVVAGLDVRACHRRL